MESIGYLAIAALVVYFIIKYSEKRSDTAEANRELIAKSGDLYEFEKFCKANKHLSRKQALIKFYANDEEKKKKAIAAANERDKREREEDDKRNRDFTIKRVFAYKYEKFIYALFSPLAELSNSSIGDGKWECSEYLPKEYVLQKIKEEYCLTKTEAQALYNQFLSHQLLREKKKPTEYEIKGWYKEVSEDPKTIEQWIDESISYYYENELLKNTQYIVDIGLVLKYYTDVVSKNDLNMDKYIREYGQRCSEEDLIIEVTQMRK
ncbi:MAG: hypothetical protein E7069_08065 [Bacteroidales bacterium]|jgi:hypothetical protein|nr:hypothetical protein [Bacteroidales bacterium]